MELNLRLGMPMCKVYNRYQQTLQPDFCGCVIRNCAAIYNAIGCLKQQCLAHHLQAVEKARHW